MNIVHQLLVRCLYLIPKQIVRLFAKRYIAGSNVDDAVNVIIKLNKMGIMATVDILGEEINTKQEAEVIVQRYCDLLTIIHEQNLDSNVSIKPTHIGLKIDKEFCYLNIRHIVEKAKLYGNFIRIDMEDHTCTTDTLNIFRNLRKEFDNVGIVLQSYLRRTLTDINTLLPEQPNIRLCKGIYLEPYNIAYKNGAIVNENFCYCLEKLLREHCYVGIATHDEKLVWHAIRLIDELQLNRMDYEFQMLLGVTENLRKLILQAGHRLRVYVPFGEAWYAYSMRRFKENPNLAGYIIKNLLTRKYRDRNHATP